MNLGDLLERVDLLLDYVMEQWQDDSRPANVIKWMCETHWPGRHFEINEGDEAAGDGDGLFYLSDAYDVDTGETAKKLLREEFRKGEFPRYFKPDWPGLIQMEVEKEAKE